MKKLQIYLTLLIVVLLQCLTAPGVDAAEPAPNEVILYEARDYIGGSESFKLPGHLPYWGTPVGDNLKGKVSSIRLGSDVGVFLYERFDWVDRGERMDSHWQHCKGGYQISESTELLKCNDFFNALIIYRKGIPGLVGVSLRAQSWSKFADMGPTIDYFRKLWLFPPHTSSHCFDLQDDIHIDGLGIVSPKDPEHKVTAKVYKNNSCTGKAVTFPGPYSDKKYFWLKEYGFKGSEIIFTGDKTTKDSPQSILVTYEGPYNHYKDTAHVKAPPSRGPQWVEEDTDRPGKDYHSFWMMRTSPEMCREACEKDSKCKAYTYVPPGLSGDASKARCWLKYDVPQPVTREGMVSGVKRFFDHAKKAPGGSATGPGIQLPPKIEPGKAGAAQADAIRSFHLVETKGNHLIFEVDYSVEPSHGNIVYLGGWIYDSKGQGISGYKPLAVAVPGAGKARLEVTLDSGQGNRGKEIEFFLYEPNKGPFVKKRFPLNMRLPGASTQPPKVEMSTGYVTAPGAKAQGDQHFDLSGTWKSNIGLVYKINQKWNEISYQDPMMHKPVNGTVDGNTVTVSWMEGNAMKSLKGTITSVGNDGVAKRIEWQNNVIYHRNDRKKATPIHLPNMK
jgi:hypothetical protein